MLSLLFSLRKDEKINMDIETNSKLESACEMGSERVAGKNYISLKVHIINWRGDNL